jgi:glycogen debranching enzyme
VALFARNLAEIADVLGKPEESSRYGSEAHELGGRINERLWDPQAGFYFDWGKDGTRHNVWTIAAFWPMLAGIASESQVDGLAAHLEDPRKFARIHRVPTVPADQEGYDPTGGYWRGAVWAPTDMMVVRGLERCGRHDLAHAIAMNHLRNVTRVFEETGTLWENYAPDSPAPGLFNGNRVAPDFVGWTGIGPIVFLIEHGIGLHVDAPARRITWRVRSRQRIGVQGLQFGDTLVDLICEPANQAGTREIRVHAGGEFELEVRVGDEPRIFRVPPRTEVVYRVDSETGAAARDHGDPP